jgi:hypothetical protein
VRNETASLDRCGFGVVSGAAGLADLAYPVVSAGDYMYLRH